MEDKSKLMAVITGAISAYIQVEQPPLLAAPETTPEVKSQSKVSRWKISGRQKSTTVDKKFRR